MKAVRVNAYGGPIHWIDVERPILPNANDGIITTTAQYLGEDD